MRWNLKLILFGFLAFSITLASAQETCTGLVEDALNAADDLCGELGRNQACYGNVDLTAQAQPDASEFTFDSVGDVVDVDDLLTLQLSELNEDAGTWGVAVMTLQADIPNTLPGQNVTFILFGDVYIENAASDEQTPMQAFYLQTGIGDIQCEEAPESGLLVQTPDGVDEVTFNVNGVDVQVGSTALFQTEASDSDERELVISTVEGSAAVIFDDETYPAVEGTQIRLPVNDQLLPIGRPGLPQAYEQSRVAPLPIGQLPRAIELAPPLVEETLQRLQERIQNGEPPCGIEGLPACENVISALRDGANLPLFERWGERFEEGTNCIPFEQSEESELPICPPTTREGVRASIRAVANDELEFDGDFDDDGIINAEDACPLREGLVEFSGCPSEPADSDGDGIVDALDYCPYEAGDSEARGCQELPNDTDGDGFPNAIDVCPFREGLAEFRGCPSDPREVGQELGERDADGDGVPNSEDACPARHGAPETNGCPPPPTRSP